MRYLCSTCFAALLVACSFSLFAQSESRITIVLTAGVRPLQVPETTVHFEYVDESPSMDYLNTSFGIDSRSQAPNLRGGVEIDNPNGLAVNIFGEVAFGQPGLFSVEVGIGKAFGKPSFQFRPTLNLGFGSGHVKLGDIEQNDLFIQVNETRFYSQTVAVTYRNHFFALRPNLDLTIPLKKEADWALRLAVGYNYALRLKGNSLGFSGEDESETAVSDSKKLSSPNVRNLSFQSEKSSDHLIGYNGLMLNVGLAWRI